MSLYLGLMSGTSMDGIDAALLEIEATGMQVRAAAAHHWPLSLQARLRHAAEDCEHIGLTEFGQLDTMVALEFAQAAEKLLTAAKVPAKAVRAIGSHGQTILHRPRAEFPFTLQIGDPNVIAALTGIDRCRPLELGGPLRFDPNVSAHDHAVCEQCGAIRDVVDDIPAKQPAAFRIVEAP